MTKPRVRQRGRDIDNVLQNWEFVPGQVSARRVKARDGRELLQMRVDMGLLQMETEARPDGTRPGGAETYYDHLVELKMHYGDDFTLDEEQCLEVDREFMQYYQRRLCWLALRDFRRAVDDADHNLALMDLVRECSPSDEWMLSHEQYRPFVLYHRSQAAALADLEEGGAEEAIDEINQGLARMKGFFSAHELEERFEEDEMVEQLLELREALREQYGIGQTLTEQLEHAIQTEQYELAAELRDQISRRLL